MATLDWSQCRAVESIPGKVSGAWVFKDTRTPVAPIFENLQDGMAVDDLIEQFPITRDPTQVDITIHQTSGPSAETDGEAEHQIHHASTPARLAVDF